MKVVSIKKQSKKAQRAFYAAKRGSWNGVNPVTRVVPSGKQYSRAKAKAAARKTGDPLGLFMQKNTKRCEASITQAVPGVRGVRAAWC